MGLFTAITATALSAGLVAGGVTVASASDSSITLPPGGVLEQRVTSFCHRVPQLTVRVGKAQARLSGDASTKGSIKWLQAKQEQADKSNHDRVARKLDRVIDRRQKRLARLPQVTTKLAQAKSECATLDLPQPSSSSSAPAPSSGS